MRPVALGSVGLRALHLGHGCTGKTPICRTPDPAEVETTRPCAVEFGRTFIDTAGVDADGANKEIRGRALEPARPRVRRRAAATRPGGRRASIPDVRAVEGGVGCNMSGDGVTGAFFVGGGDGDVRGVKVTFAHVAKPAGIVT